ncbi:hypothetical protein [Aeromicrobium sp. UC242_57]|uniref:hypothetical protein n=1 Tax=Aeromicrobium sp. UC242_57 TaxID=3374624 RepID=UPI0037B4804D
MTEPEGTVPEQESPQVEEAQPAEAPAEPTVEQQAGRAHARPAAASGRVRQLQAPGRSRSRLIRAQGEANVLQSLLTVLDDLGRADEHGELTGGFKAVADSIQQAIAKHRARGVRSQG